MVTIIFFTELLHNIIIFSCYRKLLAGVKGSINQSMFNVIVDEDTKLPNLINFQKKDQAYVGFYPFKIIFSSTLFTEDTILSFLSCRKYCQTTSNTEPKRIYLEKIFISPFVFTPLEHLKFIEKIKIENRP